VAEPVPPTADLPLAANGEVKAYDRHGNKVTVPKEQVGQLYGMGGRVAKRAEVDETIQQEKYDKQTTAEKVGIHASMLGPIGYPVHAALRSRGVVAAPEVEAYTQGVSQGFTGGMASAGMKEAIEQLGDKKAAKAYAETARVTSEAHSGLHTAGEIAGFLGGASSGSPIGRAGGVAEGIAKSGLAGVAERGVMGRAAAAAGTLGARGAAEGALYSGASQVSADMLGDRAVATDKVFAAMGLGALAGGAGGALLGGGGSLAVSGAKGVGSKLVSSLARGGEEAAVGGAKAAEAAAEGGVYRTAAQVSTEEAEKGALSKILGGNASEAARDFAYDRAVRATGARKAFVKEVSARVDGGTKAWGETILRHGLIDGSEGILSGAMRGTPEAMLPRAATALESVGQRIGHITDASPATITGKELIDTVNKVVGKYSETAATRPAARSLQTYVTDLADSLGMTGMQVGGVLEMKVPVQKMLAERRALGNLAFEGAIDAGLQKQIKRELTGELESLITKAMDDASGKVPGELAAEYKALKKDYQILRITNDALEDSISRGTANRTFSLTDKITGNAVGAAGSLLGGPIGGLVAGPGAALASKFIRERGDAAIALTLAKVADMQALTTAVRAVDEQVGRAAKGMLHPPKPDALVPAKLPKVPEKTEPVRVRAQKVVDELTTLQTQPERVMDLVTRRTEAMHSTAPEIAQGVQTRAVQAIAFLASKMPHQADPDPLDPHPAPRMSDGEAATFMRYVEYTQRPMRFFEDLERGKLTFEGAEVARELMPGPFAELQQRTITELANLRAMGKSPAYQQRQLLGAILAIPATPSQRPDHMAFLQQNVKQAAKMQQPAPPKRRPLPTKPQHSSLDRLEGK
jgi:hypothetical protein